METVMLLFPLVLLPRNGFEELEISTKHLIKCFHALLLTREYVFYFHLESLVSGRFVRKF